MGAAEYFLASQCILGIAGVSEACQWHQRNVEGDDDITDAVKEMRRRWHVHEAGCLFGSKFFQGLHSAKLISGL